MIELGHDRLVQDLVPQHEVVPQVHRVRPNQPLTAQRGSGDQNVSAAGWAAHECSEAQESH